MIAMSADDPRFVCTDAPVAYAPSAHGTSTPTDIMTAPMTNPSSSLPTGLRPRNPTEENRRPSLNRTHRNSSSIVPANVKNSLNW